MVELIEANWLLLVIALVIGILVAWWLFVSSRRTKVEIESGETDADEKSVRRNQALIDAPPAAQRPASPTLERSTERQEVPVPPATPAGLAGAGEAVQAASVPEPAVEPDPVLSPAQPVEPDGREAAADSSVAARTSHVAPPQSEAVATGDDLTRIKGLGPKIQLRLNELGVTAFSQIAAWDEAEIDRIDGQLDRFSGRIRRDNWVEQARLLNAGDVGAYEDRFGKL